MTERLTITEGLTWPKAMQSLQQQNIRTAYVGIFDLFGTFRQRRLKIEDVDQVFDSGGTFVNVLPHWDAGERVFGAGPFLGEPVAVCPSSIRNNPFEPDSCFLIADFEGPSASLSPRKLLQAQIEKATQLDLGIKVGFEFEFFVLKENASSLRQTNFESLGTYAEENRCWSGDSAAAHAEFVAELEKVLDAGQIDMLALGLELGPGCFEATLRHSEAMSAADAASFFKLITRTYCRKQNLTASFMAQIGAAFPGLSGHIHLSLFDLKSGKDIFPDRSATNGMSNAFTQFVGGILQLAPQAMPLTHHTANSYRRHSPGNWAPKSVSWAVQNYSAAVRVIPSPSAACRLEYRLPGSDINPHLALAFVLGAGLWGLENKAVLPDEFQGGGPDDQPLDANSLPHDLHEATAKMESSSAARTIWGEDFVSHLITACRAEEIALRRETSSAERARYLEVV